MEKASTGPLSAKVANNHNPGSGRLWSFRTTYKIELTQLQPCDVQCDAIITSCY